jgi:hypothetical protein
MSDSGPGGFLLLSIGRDDPVGAVFAAVIADEAEREGERGWGDAGPRSAAAPHVD